MYVCIQHVSTIHVIPCYILIPSDPKKFGHLRTVTPVLTLTSSHNGRWHNYKFIQIISTIHMLIIISYDIPIKISLKPSNISSWYPQNGESSWCLPHHSHSICIYTSLSHSWMIFAWTPRYISVPDYRSLSPCIPSISPCLSPSIIFTAYIPIIFPFILIVVSIRSWYSLATRRPLPLVSLAKILRVRIGSCGKKRLKRSTEWL